MHALEDDRNESSVVRPVGRSRSQHHAAKLGEVGVRELPTPDTTLGILAAPGGFCLQSKEAATGRTEQVVLRDANGRSPAAA